jgi:hypothetical protein
MNHVLALQELGAPADEVLAPSDRSMADCHVDSALSGQGCQH